MTVDSILENVFCHVQSTRNVQFFWDELEQIKVWTPQIGTTYHISSLNSLKFRQGAFERLAWQNFLGKLGGYNGSLTDYSTTKKAWLYFRYYCKIHK